MFEEHLKIYDEIVAEAGLERKGKTMPYTSSNGYMFSQLNKAGEMGIRLSKEDQKRFLSDYQGSGAFRSYGAVMKDYVLVPESLFFDKKIVTSYLLLGHSYVNTLTPK